MAMVGFETLRWEGHGGDFEESAGAGRERERARLQGEEEAADGEGREEEFGEGGDVAACDWLKWW